MSARHPHDPCPDERKPRVHVFHFPPEPALCIILERGYPVSLYEPEINDHTIKLLITSTRAEMKEVHAENKRRVHDMGGKDAQWWATYHESQATNARPPRDGYAGEWTVRTYGHIDLITDTCRDHDLRGRVIKITPTICYWVVRVWATREQFRAAEFDWLQKMIATQPRQPVLSTTRNELDLFA